MSITTGADGNLWYTKQEPGRIGRVTPEGDVTEFPLPSSGGWPSDLVAGPDGNIWFTKIVGSLVGRITPSGVVTTWQLTAGRGPSGIVVGADGALWFAHNLADGVGFGRITTSGTLSEFPAGGPVLFSIAPGPDGQIWFVDDYQVKRISTTGTISTVADADAVAVARGPGDTMWVVERQFTRGGASLTQVKANGELVRNPVAIFPGTDYGNAAIGPGETMWWAVPGLARLARLQEF